MKSICNFELKQEYEDYINETDMLALVEEEDKVYLKKGHFSFCIHGYFTVPSDGIVYILGEDVILDNFAALKYVNLDTGEVTRESSSISRTITLTAGNWRIDYGLYQREDKSYTAPASMFNFPATSFKNRITPHYILIDPIVTKVSAMFIMSCPKLTGAIFGELDLYPEVEVFDEPYSHNDVIINTEIEFTNNGDSHNFLGGQGGCPLVRNIYVGDGVKFFGCFGYIDVSGYTNGGSYYLTPLPTKTLIYLGDSVLAPPFNLQYSIADSWIPYLNLSKITKFIVSPNNPNLEYDDTVLCLVSKGTTNIVTGTGIYRNDLLQIPSGYRIQSYRLFEGHYPKIVDLSNFDDNNKGYKNQLMGIRDMFVTELLILPKTLLTIEMYRAGFENVETLIVPTKVAPICKWGSWGIGGKDLTNTLYDYSFATQTNWGHGGIGNHVPLEKRKLYVIEGTAEEKATWTNPYDDWLNKVDPSSTAWWNSTTNRWERPNLWHDICTPYNEGTYKNNWTALASPYLNFELIFVPENEMDALILTKIQEKLSEIQNRNN